MPVAPPPGQAEAARPGRYPPAMVEVRQCPGDRLDAATLYGLLQLRCQVFVVEQACPYLDLDGLDLAPDTLHVWCEDAAGPTAAVRVLTEAGGRLRVGRVVTRPDARGGGLARSLIRRVLADLGPVETVLHAQSHLRRYYEDLGYRVDGPELLEDGIPHLPMRRPAGADGARAGGPG
jgi:ElaA protein